MGLVHGDDPLLSTPGIHDHYRVEWTLPAHQEQQLLENVRLE